MILYAPSPITTQQAANQKCLRNFLSSPPGREITSKSFTLSSNPIIETTKKSFTGKFAAAGIREKSTTVVPKNPSKQVTSLI